MSREVIRTVCPRNCYSGCGMLAHVEDGRLLKVTGDPSHPATQGRLCSKGYRYVERVYSSERLLHPLLADGERGAGQWRPISWEEALDRIAERLITVRESYGPEALLYCTGTGMKGVMAGIGTVFLNLYGGYSYHYGDLCWPAGIEACRLTFGRLTHQPPEDYRNCRCIILWGKNAAATNQHQMPFLLEAVRRGASLIVIDPLRTQTAARATWHIQPNPGSDGALALAMAHVILAEGLHDAAFCRQRIEGFEAFAAMVREYVPEESAAATGVPAATIRELARHYATRRPANINVGFGIQRYTNGGQTVRAIAALAAITGNIGIPGGGLDYANRASYVYGNGLPQPPAGERIRPLGGRAALGRTTLAATDPPIAACLVERASPVTQNPDTSAVLAAFRAIPFTVVIEQFMTDTAALADIVLPAKTMFEEADLLASYWHPYLQYRPQVIEPPGECRSELRIYGELARRLDLPMKYFELDVREVLERSLPADISLARLEQGAVLPSTAEAIPFANGRFDTPSGKIELLSRQAAELWQVDPLPRFRPPAESRGASPDLAARYPLQFFSTKPKHRIHSQWNNDEKLRRVSGQAALRIHPLDAAARGLADGARARVFNDRGSITLPVKLDDAMKPGVVNLESGLWIGKDGVTTNFLTSDAPTDMNHGATFYDCLVEVERVG
ncbi:MAG: molybdopterin-dependent oxidoreductase [Candidatus Tectomicrobia bacterium]|nr:molybdopterin-dependent oxidoreductase [Candidatus Tectomicrobia bacterium]